jgi:tetratricopeptide (TPR) repeat protein
MPDDPLGKIKALIAQGRAERAENRLEKALAFYLQAADLSRDQSDPLLLAHIIRHVGDIHWQMGDADLAEPCFEEALEIYRTGAPSAAELANALRPMALLKEAAGDKATAYDLWAEAHDLYAKAGIDAGVEECARHAAALSAGP